MRPYCLAVPLAFGISCGFLAGPAQAIEGGASLYLPGLRGPLADLPELLPGTRSRGGLRAPGS